MRVVSLLPSATDTVVALGLERLLVARSHECDAPEVASLPAITSSRMGDIPVADIDAAFSACVAAVKEMQALGTALAVPLVEYGLSVYALDSVQLAQLRPDVVLTCLQTAHSAMLQGELLEAGMRAVLGYTPTVVHLDAEDLEGSWRDVRAVAAALQAQEAGEALVAGQQRRMSGAAAVAMGREEPRVVCIQWPHPMMAAGAWVPELVCMAGGRDVCGRQDQAVSLTEESLKQAAPDVVIFALCGLPLAKATQAAQAALRRLAGVWAQLPAAQTGRVAVVDGEHVLSRPGPLLSSSLECVVEILHSEAQQFGHEGKLWQWLPQPA